MGNILNNFRIAILAAGDNYSELENNGRKCYKIITPKLVTDLDSESGREETKLVHTVSYYNYFENKGKYDEKFAYQQKCPPPYPTEQTKFAILFCVSLVHFVTASVIISRYGSSEHVFIYNIIGTCVSAIVYFAGTIIYLCILSMYTDSDWSKTIQNYCKITILNILILLFTSTCMFIFGFCISSNEENSIVGKLFLATLYGNLSLAVMVLLFLFRYCTSPTEKEKTDAERRIEYLQRIYLQFTEAQRLDEEDSKRTIV